ncbi:TRM11 family SAM-dependent methyltransferase [Bacillus sp. DJP31]|uniref:TRM11 family SAM-dependent methyltransferase n=1 Tax=Bacillus sp. DJP31 TaxID=3409789 RepID=UPI003BB65275
MEEIVEQVKNLPMIQSTFKVLFVKLDDPDVAEKVGFKERRAIEREVGLLIPGEPDLISPKELFGIIIVNGRWIFGRYQKSEAIWLKHQQKPHGYSTALSTRVARAVANIAVPRPEGIKAIDPCCGIGTVLVEALSMGIDMDGSDINHLITNHTNENISHFGFKKEVVVRDIRKVTESYDSAIIDMPYNLCSVVTPQEQLEMLESTRKFSKKLVVVTIETIDSIIENAGFTIVDRCIVSKGGFIRQIIVCE